MSERIAELVALIRAHHQRLEAVHRSMESALDDEIARLGRTRISALIVAGLLENYYTCLETIFLRISQSFDNNLDPARWHNDLLQKMTLEIEGVRTTAVSEETFSPSSSCRSSATSSATTSNWSTTGIVSTFW